MKSFLNYILQQQIQIILPKIVKLGKLEIESAQRRLFRLYNTILLGNTLQDFSPVEPLKQLN